MRNVVTAAAFVVFVVSTGLLEMARDRHRPITELPPALSIDATAVDGTTVTSATR